MSLLGRARPKVLTATTLLRQPRTIVTQTNVASKSYEHILPPPEIFAKKTTPSVESPLARKHGYAYWQHIEAWKDVSQEEFLSYRWQVSHRRAAWAYCVRCADE